MLHGLIWCNSNASINAFMSGNHVYWISNTVEKWFLFERFTHEKFDIEYIGWNIGDIKNLCSAFNVINEQSR